ncbi:hexose transporter HT2 [Vitis vinifera]|uniref:Hexose transporter HT2 n=1 Tax=Vitis vinifera TaxID=29760 RepID=Q6BDD4_VITVI|nr:hexose transporter HT2 [Vitis vinifera]AAT77693.2 hexose transporter HT2 [Vitis vinifera]|eukprot:NP_001267817.1 hexose transporter HT2 [Vitis vinifera]
MAVGGFAADDNSRAFSGKVTASVVITCIVAASGGLIFGYDIGISGGVTTMQPFLKKFFPVVLRKAADAKTNIYCVYDSHVLTAFTSSLYIAGLAASLVASRLTRAVGRRNTMIIGGLTFLIGAALNGGAENVAMLILGRILLGFGVGFTNQATPIYLSEMAPPKWRGAFGTSFQFFIGIGVVVANCLNYGTAKISWGWRLSLGLAIVPSVIMTVGALLISDTPSSLVERGKVAQARDSLRKARGKDIDIEPELAELVKTSEAVKAANEEPFVTIFERQYRPHLVMAFAIPFFQQLTGINIIAFYAPVLFQSVGFGSDSALIASIILGCVNLLSIIVSTFIVDRYGRRILFLEGGTQMIIGQVAVACVLAVTTGVSGTKDIPRGYAVLVLVLMCIYAAGFGWSWGPLSWLIPSEIFPMKIRTTGQAISVAVNFATTFVLAQTFLTMLCHFKYGTFLFYAGWLIAMTLFVILFVPETKGIPLESMYQVWERHWFWRRFVSLP